MACPHRLLRDQYVHQASLCDSVLLLFALDQMVRSPYHYLANKAGMDIYQSGAATGSRTRWLLNERRRARVQLRIEAAKAKGDDIDYVVIQPNTLPTQQCPSPVGTLVFGDDGARRIGARQPPLVQRMRHQYPLSWPPTTTSVVLLWPCLP